MYFWNFLLFNAVPSPLKGLFTLVIYLLEFWEFIGFVTYKTSQHCYCASETCRGPRANQNVFKCMTCMKLMKIHDFSLSGLLWLKSSEKGECKKFHLILLILESFPSLAPCLIFLALFCLAVWLKKIKIRSMLKIAFQNFQLTL